VAIAGGVKKELGHSPMINGKIINNKILLHTAQWYITHTCNISCANCLSYNNFAISGHDSFDDNIEAAKAWNKIVTIKDFTIVGGETFTHNNLDQWAIGLREVFSDIKDFKIITNGTLLPKYVNRFDAWFDLDIIIEISFKRISDYQILNQYLSKYNNVQIKQHLLYDQAIYINNKLCFLIEFCDNHRPWAVNNVTDNVYQFWDNDAEAAHKKCWQKYCHYFYQGKLYKCGTVVGAQEFVKKYKVKEECKNLYLDYNPINYNDEELHSKILELNYSIPQCSMCPIASEPINLEIDIKKLLP
jgi:hypothetical protein